MKAVNLLPSAQRGSTKTQPAASISAPSGGSSLGAWLLIGVLGVAVVCSALYVMTSNTISERKAKLSSVTAEAAATQAQAKALQTFADFQQLATQRVTTVTGLASSRFDWERTLRDLSRALPSDVYIQQMQGSTGQASAASADSGATPTGIQAPSIHMTGCTNSQSSVARMMSRLRIVRGVTRVALTKSDKDGNVTAPTVAPVGETPAEPCPKGTPPAFDVTIYFERSPLAQGALPNLGAAQAAPATSAPANGSATQPSGSATQPSGSATETSPDAAAPSAKNMTPTTQPVSDTGATTQGGGK